MKPAFSEPENRIFLKMVHLSKSLKMPQARKKMITQKTSLFPSIHPTSNNSCIVTYSVLGLMVDCVPSESKHHKSDLQTSLCFSYVICPHRLFLCVLRHLRSATVCWWATPPISTAWTKPTAPHKAWHMYYSVSSRFPVTFLAPTLFGNGLEKGSV